MKAEATVDLEGLLTVLIEEGCLKDRYILPKVKPAHGSCCCCVRCGHSYDDCVCDHNNLLQRIMEIVE